MNIRIVSIALLDIPVRMDDGRQLVVTQDQLDGVSEGSRAVVRSGRVQLD